MARYMVTLNRGDRLTAGLVSGGLVALLLWALIVGLAIGGGVSVDDGLKLFGVLPPPPPPREKPVHPKVHNFRPSGRAAPPNLRAKPTEVVAPVPVVPPPEPPPIPAAKVAGEGAQASAGAADVAGPGTGAGGAGDGFGGGGDGNGDGAGDVPPRRIGGRLNYGDLPRDAREAGVGGTVGVRFVVAENGRVPSCEVTRSSGNRMLDDLTCRLIVQRYRFRPAHDAGGEPFESRVVENETWVAREEWERE